MKISDSIDPHILPSVKLKAFWVLDKIQETSNDRFNVGQISTFLVEKYEINISRQAILYALQSDRKATHKNKNGYKLMEYGRKQLKELNQTESQKEGIIMIESGQPYSAKNIKIRKIFSSPRGVVYISDPFFDVNTLDVLFKNLDKNSKVKFLTSNVTDKPKGSMTRQLADIRKEGYQIEVGVYSNSTLHDRYIMTDESFWLSGNSLNHLGNKESFIVKLGEDIRQSMLATFNNRWKVANKI